MISFVTIKECPIGHFRSAEVSKCITCPPNSSSSKPAAGFCTCLPGYYRHPLDGKHMPCYKPPGPPGNLTLLFVDHISAILSWNPPIQDHVENVLHHTRHKYRSDVVYKVVCSVCSSNVVFTPSSDTFRDTKLTLTNLETMTTYTIRIHSMNSISYLINTNVNMNGTDYDTDTTSIIGDGNGFDGTNPININNGDHQKQRDDGGSTANGGNVENSNNGHINDDNQDYKDIIRSKGNLNIINNQPIDLSLIKTEYAEIVFSTTESALLSTVTNVRVLGTTSTEVDLIWDKPLQNDFPIEFYEVRWFSKPDFDAINRTVLNTKQTKAHIENLNESTEYGFQVRYKTLNGFGTYSNIVYAQTQHGISSGMPDNYTFIYILMFYLPKFLDCLMYAFSL